MPRRRFAVLAAALVLTACSSSDEPKLKAPSSGEVGGELPDTPTGTSIIVPMPSLCSTGSPIRITGVTAASPTGGMHVTSWGVRHIDADTTDVAANQMYGRGRVESIRGFTTTTPVTFDCKTFEAELDASSNGGVDDDPRVDQFDVSVAATAPRGTMEGVTIHYGSDRTAFAQYDFALCSTHACPRVSLR